MWMKSLYPEGSDKTIGWIFRTDYHSRTWPPSSDKQKTRYRIQHCFYCLALRHPSAGSLPWKTKQIKIVKQFLPLGIGLQEKRRKPNIYGRSVTPHETLIRVWGTKSNPGTTISAGNAFTRILVVLCTNTSISTCKSTCYFSDFIRFTNVLCFILIMNWIIFVSTLHFNKLIVWVKCSMFCLDSLIMRSDCTFHCPVQGRLCCGGWAGLLRGWCSNLWHQTMFSSLQKTLEREKAFIFLRASNNLVLHEQACTMSPTSNWNVSDLIPVLLAHVSK